MANAKCRSCDHAADAGAYCNSCAANIMAKALNPLFGGGRKKFPRPGPPRTPAPPTQRRLFQSGLSAFHRRSHLVTLKCQHNLETGVYIIDQIGIPNKGEHRQPIGDHHGKGVREPAADLSEEILESVVHFC